MPFLKATVQINKTQPPWKEFDKLANKKGFRRTVFAVNGDQYTGEWQDNLKHGKGSYKWKASGAIYEGDWKVDKRNGFGTYSIPKSTGGFHKQYSGGWKNDKKHGFGTMYYTEDGVEFYEGEWYGNKRSGWGRMYYADGSKYEGEWFKDKQHGQGMLVESDENRYEGSWAEGNKHGPGQYFYLDKGQVYEGTWVNNLPKCGTLRDMEDREMAPDATKYPIPMLELLNPDEVLQEANEIFMADMS